MFKTIRPFLITFVVAAITVAVFFVVVGPLFKNSGPPQAEVNGLFDTTLTAGRPGTLPISVDNTGDSEIDPLCLGITFSRPVSVTSVVFDNNDTKTVINGRVCGGGLIGQETINVVVNVTMNKPGQTDVTITPLRGSDVVGKPLQATITVSP